MRYLVHGERISSHRELVMSMWSSWYCRIVGCACVIVGLAGMFALLVGEGESFEVFVWSIIGVILLNQADIIEKLRAK